jgi:integrase
VLLLTGQRREEVAGMAWGELDRKAALWTIPASRAKNGKAHLVPLAPAVIDELDRLALAIQVKAKAEKPDATTAQGRAGDVDSRRFRCPAFRRRSGCLMPL